MPYDSTSKIITSPLNTSDIALATGEKSLDVGRLCSSSKVNPFTKYKPIDHANIGSVTDEERMQANHGLVIPQYTSPEYLIDEAAVWTYTPRTRYRMLDFTDPEDNTKGYYTGAPSSILTCPVGPEGWLINSINENADDKARIPFYAFFKTSVEFQDKMIDPYNGISSVSYNHSAKQLSCCIGAEELFNAAKDMLFTAGNDARFGLALFTESNGVYTFAGAYLCKEVMNPLTSQYGTEFNPFCLYMDSCYAYTDTSYSNLTAIPKGTYTAVPFLRINGTGTFKYMPLCKTPIDTGATYPCQFTLGNGMLNMYLPYFRLGESETAPTSIPPSGFIITSQSSLYAYVYVRNNSPWAHLTSGVTIDRWVLTVRIQSGTITSAGSAVEFDRQNVATTRISPSSFTIEPGGMATLVYKIDHIWSADGVNDLQSVAGSVFIGFTLNYENADGTLSPLGVQAAGDQTVKHG